LITEQQQLAALAAGEHTATREIYRQHMPVISGWLIKNGCSAEDAADLFQESMVVLFGKAQDADFRLTCTIGTYLMSVSKHLWYKRLQRISRDPVQLREDITDGNQGLNWDEEVKVHEEREAHYELLDQALSQIGEPCRSLLQAYYHKDKSMQEITADFGYTNPDNAKNQKYKCLARLRKIFFMMHSG